MTAIDMQDPPGCRLQLIAKLQELVNDIHCIIDAMIGRESDVKLLRPSTEAVPEFVMGDPDRLKGVLLNLYTNAGELPISGGAVRAVTSSPAHGARLVRLAKLSPGWLSAQAGARR